MVRSMPLPAVAQRMAADRDYVQTLEALKVSGEPLTEPLHVLRGRENIGTAAAPVWRWHISVSAEGDVPRWADLVAVAHRLRPGVAFVVGVPPRSWWVNLHPNVLHLWEVDDAALLAQWRSEARGDTPT